LKIKPIIASISLLLLSACSSTGLFLLNSTLKLNSQHSVSKDIAFGQAEWQKLDIYTPNNNAQHAKPVLVFFYGGSWDSGTKEMYFFVADAFTRLGYVVIIPDYAKYPAARFPVFMEDGAAAIAWTKQHVANYGGDPQKLFIAGHSAGAHLGGLLLTDARYLKKHALSPLDVQGFSGLAGPYNFTPIRPSLMDVFGPPENYPNMQAMNFVNGDEPPMLLLHGAEDDTVGVRNQELLIEKLSAVGNPSTSILYPGLTHTSILTSLTPVLKKNSSTLDDMDKFFKSLL
jgi:acetyl esterase/lipase